MVLGFLKNLRKAGQGGRAEAGSEEGGIFLQNTLSGKKEPFEPVKKGAVGMYHCGPTVYGYQHIGNYRSYVFADTLKRLFLYKNFKVKQIINITDVGHLTDDADQGSDKIEEGAKRDKKSVSLIIKLYTNDFLAGLDKLNIDKTDTVFPRATEHIKEQLLLIQTLEEKGYTYKTSDGVYFDTSLFPDYGKLGKINLQGLEPGARVEANPEKKNPFDFALWKFSKPEEKRQQEWESPWGKGFPGWHIECSAMSAKYLGHHFDIHTGGVDHIPVHHNNEIAQSECTFGKPPVNYWMHNAHVMIDGKKISKSLGNVILLEDIEARRMSALALRYWFLTSHYRTQINFTWEALEASATAFAKLHKVAWGGKREPAKVSEKCLKEVIDAWGNDLDTPKALAAIWIMIKDDSISPASKRATLAVCDKLLGLNLTEESPELAPKPIIDKKNLPIDIQKLLEERDGARKAKNWSLADDLRSKIKNAGFELTDTGQGQEIRGL